MKRRELIKSSAVLAAIPVVGFADMNTEVEAGPPFAIRVFKESDRIILNGEVYYHMEFNDDDALHTLLFADKSIKTWRERKLMGGGVDLTLATRLHNAGSRTLFAYSFTEVESAFLYNLNSRSYVDILEMSPDDTLVRLFGFSDPEVLT